MDDTFILINTKEEVNTLLNDYYKLCNNLKIKINKNKTKIIKFDDSFLYCKWKYNINDKGKIILIPHKSTIYRQKRKINKMYKLNLNKSEINITKQSFIAYLNIGSSYKYIRNLKKITI